MFRGFESLTFRQFNIQFDCVLKIATIVAILRTYYRIIKMNYSKLYIAVLDEVPDHMVPVLVAHSVLGAHFFFDHPTYDSWVSISFRKCVVKVNRKEFEKISVLDRGYVYLGFENTVLNGEPSCVIPLPVYSDAVPNVLKFAKLWKPND